MSSTPLASTGVGPVSAVGPARSTSFGQDGRAHPISRLSLSQSSHASISGKADNVTNILGHAARLACLDPASFPTVYNASAAIFPDSQLAIAPLLAQPIAMVNDLGSSITFLTSLVENLNSAQAAHSATPSPPATCNLEAPLKDWSSVVAAHSSHHAIQVAPRRLKPLPPPAPAVHSKPALQKKKLATRLSSKTSQPQTFRCFLRENGTATQTRAPNVTQTHPKLLSFSPLATPSQRKPNSTPTATQPVHSSTLVPHLGSQSPIPRNPKNRPGPRLPGKVERARKTQLQHKSLRQERVVFPKDPYRSKPHNVVSSTPALLQPPRMTCSS